MTVLNKTTLKGKCPHCGSENTYIEKRGYRFWLGALGALGILVLFGIINATGGDVGFFFMGIALSPFGFLFGCIGQNKFDGKCLDCGHKWTI